MVCMYINPFNAYPQIMGLAGVFDHYYKLETTISHTTRPPTRAPSSLSSGFHRSSSACSFMRRGCRECSGKNVLYLQYFGVLKGEEEY